MAERNKKYIATSTGGFYVKVDEKYYKSFPDNTLVEKKDIPNIFDETDDLEMAVYACTCRGCEHERYCHEECSAECLEDEDSEMSEMMAFGESDI